MLMFLACLALVGVFVIIEIIGNAVKNTEKTNDDEGENLQIGVACHCSIVCIFVLRDKSCSYGWRRRRKRFDREMHTNL